MMMGGRAFVDTNVLLRSTLTADPLHHRAQHLLQQFRLDGYELWINRQVIREYLSQVTRSGFLATPLTVPDALAEIANIRKLYRIADEIDEVTDQLLTLIRQYPTAGKQIHDANIVATMVVYGIDTLLTGNMTDMKRFGGLVNLVPLV